MIASKSAIPANNRGCSGNELIMMSQLAGFDGNWELLYMFNCSGNDSRNHCDVSNSTP